MWPCVHRRVVDVVIAVMWSAVRGRLDSRWCMSWHEWLTFHPSSRIEAFMTFELLSPLCPDFCVWCNVICESIDLDHTISLGLCSLQILLSTLFTTYSNIPMRSLYILILPWFLQSSCSCRARQVAWSLGGWILRHLHGCFVLILFREPTFPVGTGSVSLLLFVWYDSEAVSVLVLPVVQSEAEAVLLARSLAVQRGTAVSEKDSCVLSSHWCHLGQCASVGCVDLCFLDVSGVGSTALHLVFSR